MAYFGSDDKLQRAALYKIFASLFIEEPSDEAIEGVAELFGSENTGTGADIRNEFNHIFLNSGESLQPYESLHNNCHDACLRLCSQAAAGARRIYAEAGLAMDDGIGLPPDHISAELFFMAYLIERGLEDMQRRFMNEHLLRWVPEYCARVKAAASTGFYKEAASLLRLFILDDLSYMNGVH